MISKELRQKFLEFFKSRGHAVVPSSSLIPDDPSVLLTTAGMQQFKKYYTGEADPMKDFGSKSTASVQKSFRTSDIDEVGDESHLTFFEMLGNFSFGGYWKKEAITFAKDFLDDINLKIGYVTVFGGDEKTRADEESGKIWSALGVSNIRKAGREDNFWGPPGGPGSEGPCGPTTEIYIGGTEIWNIVFNQYYQRPNGILEPLKIQGIDTGMGLERLAMVSQGKKNIFETDLLAPYFELLPANFAIRTKRIVADHLRGGAFLMADGVRPSNKEDGYVLRRLFRRVFVYEYRNKLPEHILDGVLHDICHDYGEFYPELLKQADNIRREMRLECGKFLKTVEAGLEKMNGMEKIDSAAAFMLYESYGLPYEIIKELAGKKAETLNRAGFDGEFKKHQEASRTGAEKKFGGHGLILDTGELKAADEEELKKVTRLHTATHLLQASLRKVLGESVCQAGSDITAERTRFDFTFERKLTDEEIRKVEDLVNSAVAKKYEIEMKEMPYEEAMRLGALHFFKEKYPATVKVYSVGNSKAAPPEIFSRELCGGPHVKNTSEVGRFKIIKQEPVGSGLRRIRATVD